MKYDELLNFLQHAGKDPSRLIFEDELTGIFNRRFLLNYFQYKIPWDALKDHPVSLIMMDLDFFKKINDTYGHPAGDQAPLYIATLLKEAAGEGALPIRYAGDEFMILLPDSENRTALQMGGPPPKSPRKPLGSGERGGRTSPHPQHGGLLSP